MWIKPTEIKKEGYYWMLFIDVKFRGSIEITRFQRKTSTLEENKLPFYIVRMDECDEDDCVLASELDLNYIVWNERLKEPSLMKYNKLKQMKVEW